MTDNSVNEGLKPCPFCRGDYQTWGSVRDGRSLGCSKCGARFIKYNGPPDNTAESRLITAWNTRTDLPPSREAVEAMVVPLVWDKDPRKDYNRITAMGVSNYYTIDASAQDDSELAWLAINARLLPTGPLPTIERAIATANKDNRARILSALGMGGSDAWT